MYISIEELPHLLNVGAFVLWVYAYFKRDMPEWKGFYDKLWILVRLNGGYFLIKLLLLWAGADVSDLKIIYLPMLAIVMINIHSAEQKRKRKPKDYQRV